MNLALASARSQGLSVFLMTLTFRHGAGEALSETLGALKSSMKALRQHRAWRRLKGQGMAGTIVSTEMTRGRNGWHPHAHVLVFFDSPDGAEHLEALRRPWLASLAGQGRNGNGAAFDVRDGSAAGDYVVKWGAAEEMSLGSKKEAKGGETPWQILDRSAHDPIAKSLFSEYASATKGRRSLVWSNGLKDRLQVVELADSDAAEISDDLVETVLAWLSRPVWERARLRGRAAILEAGEIGGAEGIEALLLHDRSAPHEAGKGMEQVVRQDDTGEAVAPQGEPLF